MVFLSISSYKMGEPENQEVFDRWFADNGDKSLRLYYDNIDNNSLIIDLGGFEGQWTSDIYSMYRFKILIFEPVEKYSEGIKRRFAANPDITVYPYGLSNKSEDLRILIDGDRSTTCTNGKGTGIAKMVAAADFFTANTISKVDLLKINIEGGEYDLLEHLICTKIIHHIVNIQIQFHSFVPGAAEKMERIQQYLAKTHYLTYQYRFVWENWRLRGNENYQ